MPRRKELFFNNGIYHVFNRFVHKSSYFADDDLCRHFLESINYYLQSDPPVSFSVFRRFENNFPISANNRLVSVVNYSLMPTHFHFTLRQDSENGVKKFLTKISSSLSHYLNLKEELRGPIFESTFKAVLIESNEQLLHLSRYIHLNSVSSGLVKRPEDYQFSSYRTYLGLDKIKWVDSSTVLDQFSSIKLYKEFVENNMEYQKSLEKLKYISLD